MAKRVLITGGCGFIGHHLVEHVLRNTDWDVVVIDKLTYASSGFDRLRDIEAFDDRRVSVFVLDLAQAVPPEAAREIGPIDYLVHMAAESHVDNSIADPEPFVLSNVLGTMHTLNYARGVAGLQRFVYFSTDEIFGPAPEGTEYKEWDRYNSSNPYSATKASGEELCLAYANTYGVPVVVTHCMNVFGERQHCEKFVPMLVRKVSLGETVTIHTDKEGKPGARFYIHARNVSGAVLFLLDRGETRQKYNIRGQQEVDNLEMAERVASIVGKPLRHELVGFHARRPGHDMRYALDGSLMDRLGWNPAVPFEDSLRATVRWLLDHPMWLGLSSE